jgi:hypothetical protein
MRFQIRACYNFDLLNMMNVLTGDPFYTKYHPEAYAEFGEALSDESRQILHIITESLGNAMISPLINFMISFIPDFENENLIELLLDENRIMDGIQQSDPRLLDKAKEMKPLYQALIPVLVELENMGFREYWLKEKKPLINEKKGQLEPFVETYSLDKEIAAMLGAGRAPEEIILYLCTFAAPHGIKVFGPRYIADVSFQNESILLIAIHEMFHPPYDQREVQASLDLLASDPFIHLAFEKKDPKYGYPEMDGFLEENVVEAMSLFIAQKVGLEPDPYGYLLKHDGGSHVFSVILLDYLNLYPKPLLQEFGAYFRELVDKMPVGSLVNSYRIALEKAGKELPV